METSSRPQTNLHIAMRKKKTNKSGGEGGVLSIFPSPNTIGSTNYAKDKGYVISTPTFLQRQPAFLTLMKRGALAFVQPAELLP